MSNVHSGAALIPQFIPSENLIKLVPHEGKMFLLSRVTSHDAQKHRISTEYDVKEDCIFYDEELKGIPSWAGFEIMAQSIATLYTIINVYLGNSETPVPGVILSVNNFISEKESVPAGTTIKIEVDEDFYSDGLCRFNCEMSDKDDGKMIAGASLTVMKIADMKSFFSNNAAGN